MRFTAIFVLLAILFLNGCQTDKNPVNVQSSAYFVPSFENGNYWTYNSIKAWKEYRHSTSPCGPRPSYAPIPP